MEIIQYRILPKAIQVIYTLGYPEVLYGVNA